MDHEELVEVIQGMYASHDSRRSPNGNRVIPYMEVLGFVVDLHKQGRVKKAFVNVFSNPILADFSRRDTRATKTRVFVRPAQPEDNLFSLEYQWYKAVFCRARDSVEDEQISNLEALLLVAKKENTRMAGYDEARGAIWYAVEPTTSRPDEYAGCVYLDKLLVLPKYQQKKRYGSRLIYEMVKRSVDENPNIHSIVVYASESSIPFYTKNGFVHSIDEDWSEREGRHFRRMILPVSVEGIEFHQLHSSMSDHGDGLFEDVASCNAHAIRKAYLKGVRTLLKNSGSCPPVDKNPLLLPLRTRALQRNRSNV